MYDVAKQKITDLVHDAKTSFYSTMVFSSMTCKELFHNMTTLLGKTTKPTVPSVHDLQQLPNIFSDFFKHKILYLKQLINQYLSARMLWHPIGVLHTCLRTS